MMSESKMNEGKQKAKKTRKNPQKEEGEAKKDKTSLFVGAAAALIKNRQKRRQKKKQKLLHKKKRRKRVKKIIMSADELKQKGNEAFKRNDFKLACELFTEAIGLDSRNHVLYSNRSAARVILIICIFCAYDSCIIHFRSVFRSSSSV